MSHTANAPVHGAKHAVSHITGLRSLSYAYHQVLAHMMRECPLHGNSDHSGIETVNGFAWLCIACAHPEMIDRNEKSGVFLKREASMGLGEFRDVLNRESYRDGAFTIERIWVKGHLAIGEHIQGWSGPETIITRKHLMPSFVINVVPEVRETELVAA